MEIQRHTIYNNSFYDIYLSSATELFNCIAQLTTQTKKCMKGNTHE